MFPIEFVTGQVKWIAFNEKQITWIALDRLEKEMSDIAGLRIMCQFGRHSQVVELLRTRKDMKVIIERDYITNKKPVVTVRTI